MSLIINMIAILAGIGLFYVVLRTMKKKRISEVQAIGWLIAGFILVVLGVAPQIVPWAANLLGVWYPPTIVISVVILLFVFITFQHSIMISQLNSQVHELSILVSLLLHEEEKLLSKHENNNGGENN